jgi:hypothetical protein
MPEQPVPDTDHVTPAPPTSFSTVAETGSVCVIARPPRLGEMLMLSTAEEPVTVILAAAFFPVFETEVAVRVIVGEVATLGGAV